MKIYSLMLVVDILSFAAFTAQAANNELDYKCYIDSAKGNKVLFYSWKASDFELRVASLPGKQYVDRRGKKVFIREVEECVALDEAFGSAKAQELDKQTLR